MHGRRDIREDRPEDLYFIVWQDQEASTTNQQTNNYVIRSILVVLVDHLWVRRC